MASSKDKMVLELPADRSIGDLFVRPRGRKRWAKFGGVMGRVALDPANEYKLRLSACLFAPRQCLSILEGVACDLLVEIEAPLLVSKRDWFSQAVDGVDWLRQAIERERAAIQAELGGKVQLTFDIEPVDL
jgi:hypothetical protein